MNIKHLGSHIENNGELSQYSYRNISTIFVVVFASFVLSAIPITYGSRLTPASSQNTVTVPGEATLWKSLGDR